MIGGLLLLVSIYSFEKNNEAKTSPFPMGCQLEALTPYSWSPPMSIRICFLMSIDYHISHYGCFYGNIAGECR